MIDEDAFHQGPFMTSDLAIFTISYAGDRDLCRDLCQSIDRFHPDTPHYLMIDLYDRPLFREFRRPGRSILYRERYLPEFVITPKTRGRRSFLSPYRLRPVGGWFVQQLAKLAAVSQMPHKAVILTDSDTEFVRPVTPDMVLRDGRTRMLRYELQTIRPFHRHWNRIAHELLGIAGETPETVNYVENIITWRPEVVRALIAFLKSRHGSWKRAMLKHPTMSEYYTYGMFVDHVPGPHRDAVYATDQKLCYSLLYDFRDIGNDTEDVFVGEFQRSHVGFGIQSNIGMPRARRERLSQRLREAHGRLPDRGGPSAASRPGTGDTPASGTGDAPVAPSPAAHGADVSGP